VAQVDDRGAQRLTDSERDWLRVRDHLGEHRYDLGVSAVGAIPRPTATSCSASAPEVRHVPAHGHLR
jgi:hypothetical protein